MEKGKGKIRNINTYQPPESVEDDKIFDKKLRQELIREARREVWELNHDPKLQGVEPAPDLLERTIDILRAAGKWNDDHLKNAESGEEKTSEEGFGKEEEFLEENTEEKIEEKIEEKAGALLEENTEDKEEAEEILEEHTEDKEELLEENAEKCLEANLEETDEIESTEENIDKNIDKNAGEDLEDAEKKEKVHEIQVGEIIEEKRKLSEEELYALLTEEDREAMRRGKRSLKRSEWWRKHKGKAKCAAAVIVVATGMFTAAINGWADPEHILKVWTEVTDSGQNIHISKTKDDRKGESSAEKDAELIKEKLGIKAPELVYIPDELEYGSCQINQQVRYAKMDYVMDKSKNTFWIYMTKEDSGAKEMITIDGEVLEENEIHVDCLEMDVNVQKLDSLETGEVYKTEFVYDNANYLIAGKLKKEQFEEMVKKIIF